MANTYLTRTQVAGNRQIFTQSIWFKLTNTADQVFISSYNDANNYNCFFLESGNKVLQVLWKKSGSTAALLNTTRKFRDPSAWYHVVLAVDTTQGTAANRIKLYVNGVQETSFSTATYPNQNESIEVNDNNTNQRIGALNTDTFFQGVASYVAQIDGTQELPTVFGETDATTGEWKIKTSITPSVAWGNNGFLVLKDGNSLTDASPNSNNFTVAGGTLTKTEDCPDNNFITLNPLNAYYTNSTFSNGNTTFASGSSDSGTTANILLDTGKWYWEVKVISKTGDGDNYAIGIQGQEATGTNQFVGGQLFGYQIYGGNGQIYNNNSGATYAAAYTAGDIIGVALDLTNNKLYFSKNGSWSNGSGAWSSSTFDAAVGAKAITAPATVTLGGYYPSQTFWSGSSGTFSMNFGNGYFGTTAVSSAGTAASTPGIFEYAVPTNYQPLSTKGLNA